MPKRTGGVAPAAGTGGPALPCHPAGPNKVLREIPAQNTDSGRTSCSEGDRPGEPGVLSMTLFFLLLLDPSSSPHSRGPGVLSRGCIPPLPRARRSSSIGDCSLNPTTRPRRPSAAKRPPLRRLRNRGPYLHDGRAKTLDEMVIRRGGRRAESDLQSNAPTEVERLQVQALLETLVATASANSPEVSLAVEEGARGAAGASATPGTGDRPREGLPSVRRTSCSCSAQKSH